MNGEISEDTGPLLYRVISFVSAASLVISTLILRMNLAAHPVSAMAILPYAALHPATQKSRLKVYSLEATNAGLLKTTEAIC